MLMQFDKIGSLHFLADFVGEACKIRRAYQLLANTIYFSRLLGEIKQ